MDSKKNVSQIAEFCHVSTEPTALLLGVLIALGLLGKEGEHYALGPVMQYLMGNYQDLGEKYWEHLPEYLKTDKPMMKMDDTADSEKHYQVQAASLEWMMAPSAELAARRLGIGDERKDLQILDVGAGSAVWSLTFARHDPGTHVTALDWQGVLEVAQNVAQRYGVQERLSTIAGNYHEVELPQEQYDLVVIANVAHLETFQSNVSLLKRLSNTIKPKGELVIIDIFHNQEKGQLFSSLYALGLGLRTKSGKVHQRTDLEKMLHEASYQVKQFFPLEVTPHTMGILLAQKVSV